MSYTTNKKLVQDVGVLILISANVNALPGVKIGAFLNEMYSAKNVGHIGILAGIGEK